MIKVKSVIKKGFLYIYDILNPRRDPRHSGKGVLAMLAKSCCMQNNLWETLVRATCFRGARLLKHGGPERDLWVMVESRKVTGHNGADCGNCRGRRFVRQ